VKCHIACILNIVDEKHLHHHRKSYWTARTGRDTQKANTGENSGQMWGLEREDEWDGLTKQGNIKSLWGKPRRQLTLTSTRLEQE
jgi:hypothetical protein